METLHFILCSYGLTFILIYGSIFNSIRPTKGKLGELFHCPLCLGFWVGIFLWFVRHQTELFTFDDSLVTGLLLGFAASASAYVGSMVFGDEGLKVEKLVHVKRRRK